MELTHSAANDAIRGIAMQFFAAAGFRREVDLQLLLVLVVRLRRLVGLAAKLTRNRVLGEALAEFDERFPTARQMRNVSEHLDDYIEGRGHRQALAPHESLGVRIWGAPPGGEMTFEWAGETIALGGRRDLPLAAPGNRSPPRELVDPTVSRFLYLSFKKLW